MADIAEQNLDPLKSQTTLKGVALSLLCCIYSTYKIQNPLSKETIYVVVIFFCVHVSLFKNYSFLEYMYFKHCMPICLGSDQGGGTELPWYEKVRDARLRIELNS